MDQDDEISPRTLVRGRTIKLLSFLTILQILFSLAIVALETLSISFHPGYKTIYAGIWCFPFFLLSWVSMLIFICSYRSIGFEFCLFIFQIFSLLAATTIIVFSAIFISGLHECIDSLCNKSPREYPYYYPDHYYYYYRYLNISEKRPILITLLVCASIIFLTNVSLIILYITLLVRRRSSRKKSKIIYSDIPNPPKMIVATISEPVYYSGDIENNLGSTTMPSAPPNMYYDNLDKSSSGFNQ